MNLLKFRIPSASSYGDWLRRYGKTGLNGFNQVIDKINKKALMLDKNTEYTLLVDPTLIEANKRDAFMTYEGFKGYRPWAATFLELPIIVYHEFRDGSAMGGVLEVLKKIFSLMPPGKRIKHVSLDSEFYTNDVIEYLTKKNVTFVISADKTQSLKETIKSIKDWDEFKTTDGLLTDRQIGEISIV